MRPSGKHPAVERATAFIKDAIAQGRWTTYLPPVRSLAIGAGVSTVSMVKALAKLREQGVVSGTERHRLRLGKSSLPEGDTDITMPRWEAKRREFEADLALGRFGVPAVVPSLKELQARYGICFQTMRKIFASLVTDGVVKQSGEGWTLSGVPSRHLRQRITMIVHKGFFADESAINQPNNRIVNLFENECMRRGFQLEIIEIDFYSTLDGCVTYQPQDSDALQGFILEGWMVDDANLHGTYVEMLGRITRTGKAVAILDHNGNFDLPQQLVLNRRVQVYKIEGRRAGERIARYLMSLGHRSIVYLSPLHYTWWSRSRFEGIADQFCRAGIGGAVHTAIDTTLIFLPAMLTASGLSDDDVRSIMALKHTPSQTNSLEKEWMEFKKNNKMPFRGYPQLSVVDREYLVELIALNRRKAGDAFKRATHEGALDVVADKIYDMGLQPLFAQAIAHNDATAWVCANDRVAFGALSFLQKRKIKVPGDISVTGFDNAPIEALERRLTTFDFNALEFIHRMLSFIVHPPKINTKVRHVPIEVEGIIVERDTTARAKG